MSKTIVRSLLFAFAGVFALSLHAEPAWTTGSCAPNEWQALGDNILLNVSGATTADGVPGYASGNVVVLTDGSVPTTAPDKAGIFGFRNSENVSWTFAEPKTIDQIRISTCYLGGAAYDGVHIAKVETMFYGGSTWEEIAGDCEYKGESTAGNINYVVLDNGDEPVAQNIVGLKITFGTCETGYANYYAEIEAVGSAGALGPAIGAFAITPAKTKATISGSLADAGTDATECDVYLSLDNAEAVKIAEGVTGAFEYRLKGLSPGTEYTYTLSVSNNAPTAKGTLRSGSFTTLAADASTAVWTTSEGVPGDFSPMADNILSNMVGITTGTLSGYGGSVDLLTNGKVSGDTKQTCGFYEDATVSWSFDTANALKSIRFTTCYTAGSGWYDDIKISKIEVKTSDSDSWTDLGVEPLNYAGSGTAGTALFATLWDVESGWLVRNATALRITFGKPNNVAQYYAEIEAVGRVEPKPGFVLVVR